MSLVYSPDRAVFGHGDGVADQGPAGPHGDPLDERPDERLGLGDLAGQQELAHLRGEGGDDIGAVQQLATLGQDLPGLDGGQLELFLALLVLADAVTGVGGIEVGVLDDLPDAVQPALDLDQLLFHGFQGSTLFARDAVHLLVKQFDQGANVALGEHVRSQLVDDQLLELLRRQSGTLAGFGAFLDLRLADVVGVPAALGFGCRQRPATGPAADQPGEQVAAGDAARVDAARRAGLHQFADAFELTPINDRGEGVFNAHGRLAVLRVEAPDEGAGVGLVGEQTVHGGLEPGLAVGRGNAVGVECAGDVEHALAVEGAVEDAPHDGVGGRVKFQPGPGLGPICDVHLLVAVGRPGGDPEAARGGLAHAAFDFLGQVLGVELIDALDDCLHQLAGGGVVGVLGD